jgi:hypothetical protein
MVHLNRPAIRHFAQRIRLATPQNKIMRPHVPVRSCAAISYAIKRIRRGPATERTDLYFSRAPEGGSIRHKNHTGVASLVACPIDNGHTGLVSAVTRRFDGGEGERAQEFGRVRCDRRLQRTKFKNRRGTNGGVNRNPICVSVRRFWFRACEHVRKSR